jgi:hypothetical protein
MMTVDLVRWGHSTIVSKRDCRAAHSMRVDSKEEGKDGQACRYCHQCDLAGSHTRCMMEERSQPHSCG